MEIGVDFEQCEANGVCANLAPEVFDLDEDDMLHVRQQVIPEGLVERVTRAIESCPKNALFKR
jgi:ferredoxin